jgi:hypothetical protein
MTKEARDNRCPICGNTDLEIIEYLIPTEGDVYWCKVCAKAGRPAKWTDFAVYMAGKL